METLLMYLLKMLICSALLFGYYRLALYNEQFHQWNRFYLLAALFLSVFVPYLNIPWMKETGTVLTFVSAMPWNAALNSSPVRNSFSWQQFGWMAGALVSLLMVFNLVISILNLIWTYRQNQVEPFSGNVKLILTSLRQAPFSFFNWLFWRQDIDPASENGQRMLAHELTHIREYHSFDKLGMQLLLTVFWMNPFFWLIRRELNIIHEFLADENAVGEQDGAAFAAMILQAIHIHPQNELVNPFFSSQLKRRLRMITTSKAPQYSYLRRLCGLALMVGSALVLTLSVQQATAQKKDSKPVERKQMKSSDTALNSSAKSRKLPFIISTDSVAPLYILEGKEISAFVMQALKPEAISEISILKNEDAVALYGQRGRNGVVIINLKKQVPKDVTLSFRGDVSTPIYIQNGKRVTSDILKTLPASEIASVNVLKGKDAIEKYGEDGKNGVVEVITKTGSSISTTDSMPSFPGGTEAWRRYLERALNYPNKAQEAGVQGLAVISFMVAENGDLSDFEIIENPGYGLGEEAFRLLRYGPKWQPAIQNGQKVPARMLQKVTFRLE